MGASHVRDALTGQAGQGVRTRARSTSTAAQVARPLGGQVDGVVVIDWFYCVRVGQCCFLHREG